MKKRIIFLAILAILLHFFVFPLPLQREHYFRADSALNLNEVDTHLTSTNADNLVIPFKTSHFFGYLNQNFQPQLVINTTGRAASSGDFFILFDEDTASPLTLTTASGLVINEINASGVPFIFGRNLIFVDDNGTISSYSTTGQPLWSFDTNSHVTAIALAAGITMVGLLNENILFIDGNGQLISQYRPGGSRYGLILAAALSPDGSHAAVISGLYPQRFILFRRGINDYTPIFHTELAGSARFPLRINFRDNNFVSYEELGFLHTYNLNRRSLSTVAHTGRLRAMTMHSFERFQAVLSNQDDEWQLQIFALNSPRFILNNRFIAVNANLITINTNRLVLVAGDTLHLITYQEAY
ncbi:MAG: hypothetical protein FWE37_00495 [Spirochaetaceae bacterium]|nr:hypothetical protein [Spirochaetaceae bacterium]